MTQGPQLEDRLRAALRRPEDATWPDEHGAFDRFLRHRARRGRALAARAGLALVVALALAAVTPRLLPRDPAGPVTPPGRVVRAPAGGFEVTVPAGWTDLARDRRIFFPGKDTGSGVGLRPMRRAPDTRVLVYTAILSPTQYPGIEPGADPDPSVTADPTTKKLDDDSKTLGRASRPDGRPYVWRTRLAPIEVAEYAVAWPYRCRPDEACPPAARWRVLVVHGTSAEGAATRQRVLEVVRQIVETARPVTNALPGGGPPGLVDVGVAPVTGRWLLGTGGSGPGAWQAYVRQGGSEGIEDGFELHFPSRKTRPGVGVHAEDIEPTILLAGQLGILRDCLSWLSPQLGLVSGAVPENVTSLRISLAGRPAITVQAFGHDQPSRWAAFVSPPLARGTRVTRVVGLDASGRTVAESERDQYLSHPVCQVFR
jgi:hypothetical protein